MSRREELESKLGSPSNFIVTAENIRILRQWAIVVGHSPLDVNIMSAAELANLYHEGLDKSSKPADIQKIAAEIFATVMKTVSQGFDETRVRAIVKEQFDAERLPRRIEIVGPTATVLIDGPLHYATERVIRTVARNHPVYMVGPAGSGKTHIGSVCATALNLPFYITSTINEPHELTGFIDGYGSYHTTPFRQAFELGGVWVADEIDAWDASALLTANSALANGICTFPDRQEPISRNANFRIVATANTFGSGADRVYVGRNELDAASLDRFAFIAIDYDLTLEQLFCAGQDRWREHCWKVRKIVNEKRIRHVVSSRAIIMGAQALIDGDTWEDCEESYLFKGMSSSDRRKVET